MIFWGFVIIFIIGVVLTTLGKHAEFNPGYREAYYNKEKYKIKSRIYAYSEGITFIGQFILVVSIIVCVGMLGAICYQHVRIDAQVNADKETYAGIEYKVTSEACRDEFGLLSKEVVDEAQSWNEYIKRYQTLQDNFWVGIFYPNVYDQFETIDYEESVSYTHLRAHET